MLGVIKPSAVAGGFVLYFNGDMWKTKSLKPPKNSDKYEWTEHSFFKMRQYALSEQKVRAVIRAPKRTETGIAANTVAVMQPAGTVKKDVQGKEKWPQEIWVLYKLKGENKKEKEGAENGNLKIQKLKSCLKATKKIVIISAWRYPGMAPERDPVPDEIWRELEEMAI